MKTRIAAPALFGAAALLCAVTSDAAATPVDTASVTNANPALPRPKADPTTTAEAIAASAGPAEDIGADADSPPPGSSGAAKPGAATASEDIGADANSPPPGSSSAPRQAVAAESAPASNGETGIGTGAGQSDFRSAVKPKAPWWGPSVSNDRFGVKYVAQAADQPALLIRFSRDVSRDAATQNIILSKNGKPVETAWQQGSDPRTLIAPNLKPGRYTVVIGSQLASVAGESLGNQLKGNTRIR